MRADELDGVLAFLRAAERLKTVTRSGWTSTGEAEIGAPAQQIESGAE